MTAPALTLRPMTFNDWPAVHSWGRLPQFCRFQPWGPNTEEQSRAHVQAAIAAWSRTPRERWVYMALVDGHPIGSGEIRLHSRDHRQGEIAYGIHPDLWGRGLGTSVGHALLAIGFSQLRLHRVHATCDPRNLGSAAVLRKLGLTYEGRLRHTLLLRDGWRDSLMFSILEDEWVPR
ncbi:GNAT family protein [Kutzneria sp. NPDC051319]|uniref:GNAT family N-acetyltransferase n=1 Tax=Kutzneria sp. NPDC051319 TaxID=3155047 RepID=UPI003441CE58